MVAPLPLMVGVKLWSVVLKLTVIGVATPYVKLERETPVSVGVVGACLVIGTSISPVEKPLVSVTAVKRILLAPGWTTMLVRVTVEPSWDLVRVPALAPASSTTSTFREASARSKLAVAETAHPWVKTVWVRLSATYFGPRVIVAGVKTRRAVLEPSTDWTVNFKTSAAAAVY